MLRSAAFWTGLLIAGLSPPVACAGETPPDGWAVGVAQVDITPDYPVRLSGFGFRRTESEGVSQRIWAKALAVGDTDPAVLVTVETCGISDELVGELAARLQRKAGLPRARLAVTATHTHCAPMLRGVLPNLFGRPIPPAHQDRIDRYTLELLDHLENVALAALKDRRPARLSWGIGRVGFAVNRRDKAGPVDHDLPVLVARDLEGKVRAVYASYACHCVTLSFNKISGDWAGHAQEQIQKRYPDAIALVSVGCGADANPNTGVTGDRIDLAQAQGVEIAEEVQRLLSGALAPVTGELRAQWQTVALPLAPLPTRAQWEELAKRDDPIGYNARVQLARLKRGEALQTKVDLPVQTWAFGDSLAMVFLGGEVVAEYALRLKRELDGLRLWVNGYSNDVPCYIPSERVLKVGGYEGRGAMVYYDVPGPLQPGLEDRLIAAVRDQVGERFAPPFDPERVQGARPLPPPQAALALHTHPELTVDLMAAEPLVVDPVAIAFGPDGRLWVAEMSDYPRGIPVDEGESGRRGERERDEPTPRPLTPSPPHPLTPSSSLQPGGRIRTLSDTDGDGRYDAATVFLDDIPFPTGVTVWRGGVLVCAAPDILFAEDTDDDGRADVIRRLYSGFGTSNYQARVNSLEYGLDGWVHGSCGLFGGEIECVATGERVKLGNRDFRMQPDRGLLEPATGRTQQGRVRDDWGNWFGCTNSNFLLHYPLADDQLRRNPHLAPPATTVPVPADAEAKRLYPASTELQLFKLSGRNHGATAACGLGIYRDGLLGAEYRGNAFICEPVHLAVHRLVLEPRGSTFAGHRAADEAQREFLASTDPWFRPVQARTGPDGALWVVDMCRYVIEHPQWIPPEQLATVDVRAGDRLGRIYRVRPKDGSLRTPPRLDRLDTAALVAALETPNGWQRDMAGQMLRWQGDAAAVGPLRDLLADSALPAARLHALCLLEGLGDLHSDDVRRGLNDEHAGVRRHAVRLSARFLNQHAALGTEVLRLADDADPQVRLQLAYALGGWDDARAGAALADLALRYAGDPYLVAAVLSSISAMNIADVLTAAFAPNRSGPMPEHLARQLLGLAVTLNDRRALPGVLLRITSAADGRLSAWQRAGLIGILEALERGGRTLDEWDDDRVRRQIARALDRARATAADTTAADADRIAAVALLGRESSQRQADIDSLGQLLAPRNSAAVQSAALAALGRIPEGRVANVLLAGWNSHSPARKAQILDLLLSRSEWQRELLAGLERGAVSRSALDAPRRQRLLDHPDQTVRTRAAAVFETAGDTDRQRVLDDHRDVPTLRGDVARGRDVFAKRCAGCHRLRDVGHAVGPDLAPLADKSPQFFLQEILDPSRNVDSRYVQYTALTTSGLTASGLLLSETATSITLQAQDNKQQTLLRSELEELIGTGRSIMPDGLEKDLSKQDLSDLIAFLRQPPGS